MFHHEGPPDWGEYLFFIESSYAIKFMLHPVCP